MNSRLPARFCFPLLALALALLSGCGGYQLGEIKPAAYGDIHSIYVPTFKNSTLEPRISADTTNAVIRQLQMDGTYKIAASRASADAVLIGEIVDVDRRQQRSTGFNVFRTTEFLLTIVIEWTLIDAGTGEKLIRADPYGPDANQRDVLTYGRPRIGRVVGRTTAFIDPNYQLAESQAIQVAAEDAAVHLVGQLAEADAW